MLKSDYNMWASEGLYMCFLGKKKQKTCCKHMVVHKANFANESTVRHFKSLVSEQHRRCIILNAHTPTDY